MQVLSWNVKGAVPPQGSPDRIREQAAFLEENVECPDIVLLNEVTTDRRELWHDQLRLLGYTTIEDTLDWAAELADSDVPPHQDINHVNGNLTAVHEGCGDAHLERKKPSIREEPYHGTGLKHWSTNFPEKILRTIVELPMTTLDLWNVRAVPGNPWGEEKVKILENVYDRIRTSAKTACLLAGDLNAPRAEREDGTVVPWRAGTDDPNAERWAAAETNVLCELRSEGMVDVFRDQHGYGDLEITDESHGSRRFDHIIASDELNPVACHYDPDGFECSDHAPLIATFNPVG